MHRIIYLLIALFLFASCQEKTYRIGVSQCGTDDWHMQMNKDLERDANSHPELEMIFRVASLRSEEQIANLEELLTQNLDLLIVSPNDAEALVPVIEKFYDRGIPVILVDRMIHSRKFTASVSVNNVDIGERVGTFITSRLGGHGRIIEIQGSANASSSQDRHQGLMNVLTNFPDIKIVASEKGFWRYDRAYAIVDSLLKIYPDIDLITAQNDDMAYAAYEACVSHGIKPIPPIMGVDGLPGPGSGIDHILEGKLTATCINPSGANEAFAIALDILNGHSFPRHTELNTLLVDDHNVSLINMQRRLLDSYNKKIEEISGELGLYWRRSRLQHALLVAFVVILGLVIALIILIAHGRRQREKLRLKVEQANETKLSFFTNVSHSFRTPLTLIANPLHQLKLEKGLTERQQELLTIMENNTNQLLELTSQVLNVMQTDLSVASAHIDSIAQEAYKHSQKNAEFVSSRMQSGPAVKFDAEDEINKQTILIIDDNADIRQYMTLLLSSHYIVLTANNGEEGLMEAQQNIPDLIICDVLMPVMDGLECCSKLKQNEVTSHIPVLMLSAYALDDQRIEGYKSGADSYMTKPFNSDVLLARIRNLLLSRRQIDTGKENTKEQMEQLEFSSVDTSFVTHLQEYINNNMSNADLSINDLCGEMHMSRVQLYRKCKSLTNVSPVELVRNLRLKHAKQLLEHSEQTISEIAYEVGFSSPSYFAKCYRDQYGISPTESKK